MVDLVIGNSIFIRYLRRINCKLGGFMRHACADSVVCGFFLRAAARLRIYAMNSLSVTIADKRIVFDTASLSDGFFIGSFLSFCNRLKNIDFSGDSLFIRAIAFYKKKILLSSVRKLGMAIMFGITSAILLSLLIGVRLTPVSLCLRLLFFMFCLPWLWVNQDLLTLIKSSVIFRVIKTFFDK